MTLAATPASATETPPPRVVLITGAARRLGREMALTLAQNGWSVAIHYRHSEADALKTAADCATVASGKGHLHTQFDTFCADLGDESSVRRLWEAVLARFGRVDAVVNSASAFDYDSAHDFSYARLQAHIASNTAAPIVLAQCLHAHRQGSGRAGEPPAVVVNLLDQKLWNPNPDFLSYTLSKAALHSATILLAQALAPWVRVVGVAPGLTLTSHLLSEQEFAALHRLSPLGQSSTAADIADAVAFALRNRALTGTTLLVDGGQHLLPLPRDFSLMPQAGLMPTAAPQADPAAPRP